MSLFGKKKQAVSINRHAESTADAAESRKNGARVRILGSGCTKCRQLEENILEALKQLGMEAQVDHVTDFAQIAAYGVMTTPALVIENKVVSYGRVLSVQEAVNLLRNK